MLVTIENLNKSFDDSVILEGINLEIDEGDRLAILGPSGCGKTTLLNEIKNGNPAITKKYNSYSVVYQEPRLLPWKNVLENVSIVCDDIKKSKKLLENVGMKQHLDKYPSEISGGMKQRVSISRALSMEPEILFLDEPFSALDLKIRVNLIEMLSNEFMQTQSLLGLIYVTHNILDALLLANKIIVLGGSPSSIVYQKEIAIPLDKRDWKDERLLQIEREIIEIFLEA